MFVEEAFEDGLPRNSGTPRYCLNGRDDISVFQFPLAAITPHVLVKRASQLTMQI